MKMREHHIVPLAFEIRHDQEQVKTVAPNVHKLSMSFARRTNPGLGLRLGE